MFSLLWSLLDVRPRSLVVFWATIWAIGLIIHVADRYFVPVLAHMATMEIHRHGKP
jgi:hypothetical protein